MNKYLTYLAARRLNLPKLRTREKSVFLSAKIQAYESQVLRDIGEPFMKNDSDLSYIENEDIAVSTITDVVDRFLNHEENKDRHKLEFIRAMSTIISDTVNQVFDRQEKSVYRRFELENTRAESDRARNEDISIREALAAIKDLRDTVAKQNEVIAVQNSKIDRLLSNSRETINDFAKESSLSANLKDWRKSKL